MTSLLLLTVLSQYSVERTRVDGYDVVRLIDHAHRTEVSVVPAIGNNAYSMKVNGTEIFFSPHASLGGFRERPAQFGNPFLAPWANRILGEAYWVNGKKYTLQKDLGNVRLDANKNPIHGLLIFSDRWRVESAIATSSAAEVRSRLEFYRDPAALAQFPFAHAIEMTYRLAGGALEVVTELENMSGEPMPVAVGYHPWYQLPGARDSWSVTIPAKEHVVLSPMLVPTGERKPVASTGPMPLKGLQLDDVYTGLIRGADGNANFAVTNGKQTLTFAFGPKYPVGVVYAPAGREFICFEPMAAVTDAFNQKQAGKYPELQSIPPGARWRESWWIRPSGF